MEQQEKKLLREELRQIAQRHQPSAADSRLLVHQVQRLSAWSEARAVLLYAPLPHEPNLLALLEGASSSSTQRFFFPRMQERELQLYKWFPGAPWINGPHGTQEPDPHQWPIASLAEVDLALIPGLGFDRQGGRLGWGYGYFDRLLGRSECRAIKIGVALPWQLVPKIPQESHDVTMHLVVTPEK
jgi:5-formyltetrahydrofolate cyclo-ligase